MLKRMRIVVDVQSKIGSFFSKIPLTPNTWTFLSVILALFGFLSFAIEKNLGIGLFLFILSAFSDAIDGAVARTRNETSKRGAFLDGICDRIVEMFLIIGLMFYGIPDLYFSSMIWLALFLFLGTGMTSFVKAYADHTEVIRKERALMMPGILERTERLVLIFTGIFLALILGDLNLLTYAVVSGVFLAALTVLQRIFYVLIG